MSLSLISSSWFWTHFELIQLIFKLYQLYLIRFEKRLSMSRNLTLQKADWRQIFYDRTVIYDNVSILTSFCSILFRFPFGGTWLSCFLGKPYWKNFSTFISLRFKTLFLWRDFLFYNLADYENATVATVIGRRELHVWFQLIWVTRRSLISKNSNHPLRDEPRFISARERWELLLSSFALHLQCQCALASFTPVQDLDV